MADKKNIAPNRVEPNASISEGDKRLDPDGIFEKLLNELATEDTRVEPDEPLTSVDLEPRVYRVPLSEHSTRWPRPSPTDDKPPSLAGGLLARLLDDQVWVRYEPPQRANHTMRYRSAVGGDLQEFWHERLTIPRFIRDEDLVRVRELLLILSRAVTIADRSVLERVERALDALEDRPQSEQVKLARYLDDVEDLIAQVRLHEQRQQAFLKRCDAGGKALEVDVEAGAVSKAQVAEALAALRATSKALSDDFYRLRRDWLAQKHDPAFTKLDLALFRKTLMSAVHDPERHGGGGQRGPAYIAAALAVDVDAFGAADAKDDQSDADRDDYDAKVRSFRDRLQRKKSKYKKTLPR